DQVGRQCGVADADGVARDAVAAEVVGGGTVGTRAGQGEGPGAVFPDVHVAIDDVLAVGHAHQVAGEALEGDIAAVGTDHRLIGVRVPAGGAAGAGGGARGGEGPGRAVAQVDVAGAAGTGAGDQVGGEAVEDLVAAVAADRLGGRLRGAVGRRRRSDLGADQ